MSEDPKYCTGPGTCPKCGYIMQSSTMYGDGTQRPPVVGDLMVCYRCAGLLKLDSDCSRVALTKADYDALPIDEKRGLIAAKEWVEERARIDPNHPRRLQEAERQVR